jgi:hypothetical protein
MAEIYVLWHVGPLLGRDRETSRWKTTVTKQRPLNSFFYFLQIYNILYKLSNKQICCKETLVRSNHPMMMLLCILYILLCVRQQWERNCDFCDIRSPSHYKQDICIFFAQFEIFQPTHRTQIFTHTHTRARARARTYAYDSEGCFKKSPTTALQMLEHLEYHCKALFRTPCILWERRRYPTLDQMVYGNLNSFFKKVQEWLTLPP